MDADGSFMAIDGDKYYVYGSVADMCVGTLKRQGAMFKDEVTVGFPDKPDMTATIANGRLLYVFKGWFPGHTSLVLN